MLGDLDTVCVGLGRESELIVGINNTDSFDPKP